MVQALEARGQQTKRTLASVTAPSVLGGARDPAAPTQETARCCCGQRNAFLPTPSMQDVGCCRAGVSQAQRPHSVQENRTNASPKAEMDAVWERNLLPVQRRTLEASLGCLHPATPGSSRLSGGSQGARSVLPRKHGGLQSYTEAVTAHHTIRPRYTDWGYFFFRVGHCTTK